MMLGTALALMMTQANAGATQCHSLKDYQKRLNSPIWSYKKLSELGVSRVIDYGNAQQLRADSPVGYFIVYNIVPTSDMPETYRLAQEASIALFTPKGECLAVINGTPGELKDILTGAALEYKKALAE